jgi:hypothetical protein
VNAIRNVYRACSYCHENGMRAGVYRVVTSVDGVTALHSECMGKWLLMHSNISLTVLPGDD